MPNINKGFSHVEVLIEDINIFVLILATSDWHLVFNIPPLEAGLHYDLEFGVQ
jgi:hypothetical protein